MRETISENYRIMQQELHKNPNYGVASLAFSPLISEIIKTKKIKSLTDYGAGKQNLLKGLRKAGIDNIIYYPYDPAFPDYGPPRKAELVTCIDVLEHIEPELLDNVLKELSELMHGVGFFSIHMGPAQKILSDGRNAHLIQQPVSWWLPKLCNYFEIKQLKTHNCMGKGFWVLVESRLEKDLF
ncbi:hypothetical protein [Limnohabitans sp.]|jgi:hypothetical protein|uniref:hypothetical protein n=1 Tax=Limnohabitans sp. TaxID=1907725 RepID=UPI00391AF536